MAMYVFRVPHKKHTRYKICINGCIELCSKEQYEQIDKIFEQ